MIVPRFQPATLLLLEMDIKIVMSLIQMVTMVEIWYVYLVWNNSCSLVHAGVSPGNRPALTLTYFFFFTYPSIYWIIKDSRIWVTSEVFIHNISMTGLSMHSPKCEQQTCSFREFYEWHMVFKSHWWSLIYFY